MEVSGQAASYHKAGQHPWVAEKRQEAKGPCQKAEINKTIKYQIEKADTQGGNEDCAD